MTCVPKESIDDFVERAENMLEANGLGERIPILRARIVGAGEDEYLKECACVTVLRSFNLEIRCHEV